MSNCLINFSFFSLFFLIFDTYFLTLELFPKDQNPLYDRIYFFELPTSKIISHSGIDLKVLSLNTNFIFDFKF